MKEHIEKSLKQVEEGNVVVKTMEELQITEKVKTCVLSYVDMAKRNPEDARNLRAIAFGALNFAINNLYPEYNQELADWWDNEVYDQFNV